MIEIYKIQHIKLVKLTHWALKKLHIFLQCRVSKVSKNLKDLDKKKKLFFVYYFK